MKIKSVHECLWDEVSLGEVMLRLDPGEERVHTTRSFRAWEGGDFDWKRIFKDEGARWFHCGGIFAALSATTPGVAREAMECAKENGTIVSYDLNYRPSLWKAIGGSKKMIEVAVKAFPNFKAIATTLRGVKSASVNEWSATLWTEGSFYQASSRTLEILDRVGGGDSFASGLIYGFLSGLDPQTCVEYGAAHGAMTMTTPGDTSMATLAEVKNLAGGGSARVQR